MRRHAALRDLSVDHHHALVQAHRLQRAANADEETRRVLASEFLQFWRADGQRHFCEEEQALLPFFARWGEMNQEPIAQMLREHALIRRDAQLLADGAREASICKRLGEQLTAHVRLEERVVFPLIEDALPDEVLAALPALLETWHRQHSGVTAIGEETMTPNETLPAPAAPEANAATGASDMPGGNLQASKMPGHWLLARLGKTVLRPGGLELTRQMLGALQIGTSDRVVEFAPGLGATAKLALENDPASYVAVERDEAAAKAVREKLDAPNREFRADSADETGLPDACATVVYGEAMLTMQTPAMKERIVREAARLLKTGGRYGIHELCLVPDDIDEAMENEIARALSDSIHVGARPLRVREWRALLESAGLKVEAEHRVPMELLEPARLIADEGVSGAVNILWNALHDAEALARVREMRAVFRKYHDHMAAIALVAVKK